MNSSKKTKQLITEFKGKNYLYGPGVLSSLGGYVKQAGNKVVLILDYFPASEFFIKKIKTSIEKSGIEILKEIKGAGPNAPREDVFRIQQEITEADPEVIVSFGGGSTIDAAKAAEVLRALGGDIEEYFGVSKVTDKIYETKKSLTPHVAIQTVASSAAHLTKYSNITQVSSGQKKLIVDESIVPHHPVFDFEVTYYAPPSLTMDGALDGISHSLEVLFSAVGKPNYKKCLEIAQEGISLVVKNLPTTIRDSLNTDARDALCMATDLGGYAIMVGGTNGAHLTSFSLVDVLSHGRACAMMNPYYSVFFAPAIEEPLRIIGDIYKKEGYSSADFYKLKGKELGIAFAEAMFNFAYKIGFPTKLSEVKGFSQEHIDRALSAAKNPQLKNKLENMPVPLTTEMVDEYMGKVLDAAKTGDLSLIKNV